jgi:hypothetical protein
MPHQIRTTRIGLNIGNDTAERIHLQIDRRRKEASGQNSLSHPAGDKIGSICFQSGKCWSDEKSEKASAASRRSAT